MSIEDRKALLKSYTPSYAFTIHKSQGMTLEHSIVIDSFNTNGMRTWVQNLEMLYVGLSRSSNNIALIKNSIFYGDNIDYITKQVSSHLAKTNLEKDTISLTSEEAEAVEHCR